MALEIGGGITIGGNITVQIETGGTSPVNTVAPVVSGTATVGQTLSTTNGTWTGTATITFTYQWQRNGVNISSATSSTYTLVNADASNPIRCVVTGTNAVGNSSANSNATANVAAIAPGAPTIGTATSTGTTTATVAFTAPVSNGGATITTYTATSTPDNITGTLSQAGSGTINMTGLTAGTSYTFTVTATNSVGTGSASASSNSITTFSTPVNTVAPVVSGTATVGQTLSTTNGTWTGTATITFTYQWQRNGVNITSATNSTYTLVAADASNPIRCVVTGTNAYGNSSANSNATANVAAIVPGAPTIGTATATGDSTATVAFTQPASNGGATITSYTATSSPAGGTGTLSQAGSGTISVTGLTQGTTYTFTVTATNSVGTGSASAASNSITTTASYFNYNTLLLPGASTTFVDDASTNNFALTINGDTKPNNTNPYTPGYYSNYFDGSGDYLTAPNNAALNMGSSNFTIEGWYYPTGNAPQYSSIISKRADGSVVGGVLLTFGSAGLTPQLLVDIGGSWAVVGNASTAFVANRWNHFAIVRNGSIFNLYIDGVSVVSVTNAGSIPDNVSAFAIGASGANGASVINASYISNVRVVKGTAVYTSTFTPPTTPLTAIANTSLLTCQSNRFIDTSTNALTITVNGDTKIQSFQPFTPNSSYSTYGSGYFDGTGDYLSVPNNAAFDLPGDFTVEVWFNFSTIGGAHTFIGNYAGASTGWALQYRADDGNVFRFVYGNTAILNSPATTVLTNTWYHLAVTRSGSTVKMFLNGTQTATATSATSYTSSAALWVGGLTGVGQYTNGYIVDARLVVGTAVYTTTFTPPTAPLTAIANTSLLTLQNNQSVNNNVFLDNSSNNLLVTRNGNTTQGTFSPYGGNWSNYFDGTSYLSFANNANFNVGSGDYTFEAWVYQNQRNATAGAVFTLRNSDDASFPDVCIEAGGALRGYMAGGAQGTASNLTVSLNTWTHIAWVRSSGTLYYYINGVAAGSTAQATSWSAQTPKIGGQNWAAAYTFYGYISNSRFTKSAVYTTSFTPSTTPLSTVTNTQILTCQSNRLIDNSINNYAITKNGDASVQRFSPFNPSSVTPTSYSGYFDGNGDYLNVASNAAFAFGTSDFTLEFWAYPTVNARQDWLDFDSGGGYRLLVYYDGSNIVYYSGGSRITGSAMTLNTWQHIAVVRNSGSTKLYINGSQSGSTYSDSINFLAQQLTIAKDNAGSTYVTGYMSNVRVVKGVAVYTGTFTVPTSPLTATQSSGTNIAAITGTQTSLLTLQSTTFIDNSTNNFTISAFGNSQPTQQNPFGVTSVLTSGYTVSTIGGSGYFDNAGDYLTVPSTVQLEPGSGNFTIEAWVYPLSYPSVGTGDAIIARLNSSGYNNFSVNIRNNGNIEAYFSLSNTASPPDNINAGPVLLNAWTHVAFVKNGLGRILYLNGVSVGTVTSASNPPTGLSTVTNIGTADSDFNGYISGLRVTNSIVYSSGFVPPTTPSTAITNTALLLNYTGAGVYDAAMMNNMETVGDAKLSTAISKFGGSSMSFDGTGDYITMLNNPRLNPRTANFTIEAWVYLTSLGTTKSIISTFTGSGSYWDWQIKSNNCLELSRDLGAVIITGTTALTANTWIHVAVSRSGTSVKQFINGVLDASNISSGDLYSTNNTAIGSTVNNQNNFAGYIDDLRLTNGYARYTTTFTPPTSAFPTY